MAIKEDLAHLFLDRHLFLDHREGGVVVGSLAMDLLLGEVHSLKEKRSLLRPIVAELRRAYAVSAAETGYLDLHRRAEVGVSLVSPDAAHCRDVLDACERLVAHRPEVDVLSARQRIWDDADA